MNAAGFKIASELSQEWQMAPKWTRNAQHTVHKHGVRENGDQRYQANDCTSGSLVSTHRNQLSFLTFNWKIPTERW